MCTTIEDNSRIDDPEICSVLGCGNLAFDSENVWLEKRDGAKVMAFVWVCRECKEMLKHLDE